MIFQTRICCACCSTSREVTFQLCRLKYSYGKLNIFASLYRHSPVIDPGLFDVFGNFGTVTRIYKFCGFWAKLTTGPAKEGLWDWRGSCSVRGCLVKGTAAWFETSAPSSTRQLWLQLCADDGRNNCTVWICLDRNCKVTRSRGHNRMKTVWFRSRDSLRRGQKREKVTEGCLTGNFVTLEISSVPSGCQLGLFL